MSILTPSLGCSWGHALYKTHTPPVAWRAKMTLLLLGMRYQKQKRTWNTHLLQSSMIWSNKMFLAVKQHKKRCYCSKCCWNCRKQLQHEVAWSSFFSPIRWPSFGGGPRCRDLATNEIKTCNYIIIFKYRK